MIDNSKEYIICSAIHYDNHIHYPNMNEYGIDSGFVIGGYRHHNIISVLPTNIFYKDVDKKSKQLNVDWPNNITNCNYYCVDIAHYIRWEIYNKYNIILNKTQTNILVYIAYGIYAALTNRKLTKHQPILGVFGPIFIPILSSIDIEKIPFKSDFSIFKSDTYLDKIINFIVNTYYNTSALELSKWTHDNDGPWCSTIKLLNEQSNNIKWNSTPIDFNIIKSYFNANFVESTELSKIQPNTIQGFITSKGRFVNREDAAIIAFNAGQITDKVDKLFSENIF